MSNWRIVRPPDGIRVDIGPGDVRRQAVEHRERGLAAGTPVVLFASGRTAGRRCRAFAAAAGIELTREYLPFPSAATPAYLVEDAPATVRVFAKQVLVPPPRAAAPVKAGVRLLRRLATPLILRTAAPGRVAVGRTT